MFGHANLLVSFLLLPLHVLVGCLPSPLPLPFSHNLTARITIKTHTLKEHTEATHEIAQQNQLTNRRPMKENFAAATVF
jgi:hypothetical protein